MVIFGYGDGRSAGRGVVLHSCEADEILSELVLRTYDEQLELDKCYKIDNKHLIDVRSCMWSPFCGPKATSWLPAELVPPRMTSLYM